MLRAYLQPTAPFDDPRVSVHCPLILPTHRLQQQSLLVANRIAPQAKDKWVLLQWEAVKSTCIGGYHLPDRSACAWSGSRYDKPESS